MSSDGEIAVARPTPHQGREGMNKKGARGRWHPAMGEEAAVVGDVEEYGRGG